MYRLIFLSGAQQGRRVVIRQGPVILGRHPDSVIRLTDEGVALQHALLEERPGGGVSIRCLATDARLIVNRQAVTEVELQDGDQFELGSVKLQFQGHAQPGAPVRMPRGGLQSITIAAVVLMLLGQMAFLVWISAWQYGRDGVVASLPLTPEPASPPPPPAAVTVLAKAPPPPKAPAATLAGAPPGVNHSGGTDTVAREIKLMQQEMGELRQQVASLPKPAAPVTPPPAPAATNPPVAPVPSSPAAESENPVWEQGQRMLQRALAQEAALGPEALDHELEKIQIMAPDFTPPYQERARLFEQRKMPRAALTQWRELQRPTAQRAESERLAALDQPPAPVPAATAPAPALSNDAPLSPPAPARAPAVRIAAVDQQRFMTNEQFDEMRTLRITLAPRPGASAADPAGVKALVTFYDQDRDTGHITPTSAVAPGTALRLNDAATLADQPALTAAYLLPRGFREKETRQHGSRRRYYGYRVQVYYLGVLQDERARPLDLLAPDVKP
ncbi:MAG: FHA domain-containing protein [Kiritimatiellaeota bacterium]|nr:FHA domain-containing protein [Kiritimatiellota bacterium]